MTQDMCVCEMMEVLKIPQARISQHLLRLRSEGLVEDRRESQWVVYSLNKKNFKKKMTDLKRFFDSKPEKLKSMGEEFKRLKKLEDRGLLKKKLLGRE